MFKHFIAKILSRPITLLFKAVTWAFFEIEEELYPRKCLTKEQLFRNEEIINRAVDNYLKAVKEKHV